MLNIKNIVKIVAAALIAAAVFASVLLTLRPGIVRLFKHEVVISIAGDILLDRGVGDAIAQNGESYPYKDISRLFKVDDITAANLECPLTNAEGGAMKAQKFVFKADPSNAAALKAAGFDVLTLANNHTMDYVSDGLSDTMKALKSAGLLYAGAGDTDKEIQPCFIEKNSVKIGFLAYSSLPVEGFVYDGSNATIAYARAVFLDDMKSKIAEAASKCNFLIVYFHWGTEFEHAVNESQREIAHAAIDSGASFVVGAHPHVIQGHETYRSVPVYYSVGNFVFDKQAQEGTDEALILRLTVGKMGLALVDELPVVIENCRPRMADSENADEIKKNLDEFSDGIK